MNQRIATDKGDLYKVYPVYAKGRFKGMFKTLEEAALEVQRLIENGEEYVYLEEHAWTWIASKNK